MITGNIAGTGSDTALIANIAPESPRNSSLGSVVNDVLAASPDLASLVVLLAAATVSVGASGIDGATTPDVCVFNPEGAVRQLENWRASFVASLGMTGFTVGSLVDTVPGSSKLGEMLQIALDPSEQRFSLGSFVDAIDRAYQGLASPPAEIAIVVNQETEQVVLHLCSVAPTGFVGDVVATFTRTAATSPTAQWGE